MEGLQGFFLGSQMFEKIAGKNDVHRFIGLKRQINGTGLMDGNIGVGKRRSIVVEIDG